MSKNINEESITIEKIKAFIATELSNIEGIDITSDKAKADIEKLAKQKMYNIWEKIYYLCEDEDFENLADKLYEENVA
jgi:hypothetical protein